jgi:hypothetical protein
MTAMFRCYVLGCREQTIIGTIHKRFGRVVSCADHNPIRHAVNRPLQAASITSRPTSNGRPGTPVLATKPAPIIPPSDGEAIEIPIDWWSFKSVAPMKPGNDLF